MDKLKKDISAIIHSDPEDDDIDEYIDALDKINIDKKIIDKNMIMKYVYDEITTDDKFNWENYSKSAVYENSIMYILLPLLEKIVSLLNLNEDFFYDPEIENNFSQSFNVLLSLIITKKINYICGLKEPMTKETILYTRYYFNNYWNYKKDMIESVCEQIENEKDKELFMELFINFYRLDTGFRR